jgi:hypothetical protein
MFSINGGAILQQERADKVLSGGPATGLTEHSGNRMHTG